MAKILDQLRRAMERSGKSRYAIFKETGIDQGTLSRFARGQCGLSMENVEKVCECIGAKIAITIPKPRM
ncbi:MAG: helix-turn-helix domain-containing protein [Planctomycetes bacterium]|nr:helix-turn-helix domain-containing protein [Planctomycetota bacterium]